MFKKIIHLMMREMFVVQIVKTKIMNVFLVLQGHDGSAWQKLLE